MNIRDLVPWNWGKNNIRVQFGGKEPTREIPWSIDPWTDNFLNPNRTGALCRGLSSMWEEADSLFPRIDIAETEKEMTIRAELPGMKESDILLSIGKNQLTLQGEKKTERSGTTWNECRYGTFRREVPIPSGLEEEKCEATFKDGVLTITLPKSESAGASAKKIKVKSG